VLPGQLSLFARASEPSFDERYASLRRIPLEGGAWVEYAPAWLSGHAQVFEHLVTTTDWQTSHEKMYDRVVEVPRVFATYPENGPGHPILPRIARALGARYGEAFSRVTVALYRTGKDSVAFHGDRVARNMDEALVATVSVGAPRRFLMRPKGGGRSMAFQLGWGDLIVMGGTCQRTWDHGIPKAARAEPRIAIMFRPAWTADPANS
jgi:alkylated DNA repair dioxygenase AlkB